MGQGSEKEYSSFVATSCSTTQNSASSNISKKKAAQSGGAVKSENSSEAGDECDSLGAVGDEREVELDPVDKFWASLKKLQPPG